jgi:hypothetical protein
MAPMRAVAYCVITHSMNGPGGQSLGEPPVSKALSSKNGERFGGALGWGRGW